MQLVTLSSQNQITIPVEILRAFNVKSGDKLLIEKEAQAIKIKAAGESVVNRLAGSINIPKSKQGVHFDKVLKQTKKRVARKLANEK